MIRFTIALALFVLLMPISAQEPSDDCTQEQFDSAADFLDDLSAQLREGELDQQVIVAVQLTLATLRAVCDGDVFTSETYGNETVTDPIVFRNGFYRAILEAETPARVEVRKLSGKCNAIAGISVYDEGRDEEFWEFEDCIASLDISANGDWSLTLEPIIVADE